jgi:hypothetical protein
MALASRIDNLGAVFEVSPDQARTGLSALIETSVFTSSPTAAVSV